MNENTIPITRPQNQYVPDVVKQVIEKEKKSPENPPDSSYDDIPQQFVEKTKYPTEIVDLPSKGWFYPSTSPLSSGQIELKMMTAREEDILTSQNLIKKGVVLQKLVDSLIVNKKINQADILVCDMNGIFISIRRLAYGDQYGPLKITCPSCGEESEQTIDLSSIKTKTFNFENYPKGQNLFTFELPYSKKLITYKILTQREDSNVDAEIKMISKTNKERSFEITTRLKHVIQSIDGEEDKTYIKKFVENEMVSRDTFAFRKHIRENIPDMDLTFQFECGSCNYSGRVDMPLTVNFFWPSS